MRRIVFSFFASAFLLTTAVAQEPARLDQELTLSSTSPLVAGHGPTVTVNYTVVSAGVIFVWAESDDCDPFLQVESADGQLQLRNDNDGGGTTAWVRTPIQAGTVLKIQVDGQNDSAAGIVRLRIREMPGSEASRLASEELEAAFAEARTIVQAENQLAARELLEPIVEALLAAPGVEYNTNAHGTLWLVADELRTWGGAGVSLKVFEALVRYEADRYPPISRAVLQVQGTLCGLLGELGRGEDAMPWCERALAISDRAYGAGSLESTTSRFNLGLALLMAYQPEAARDAIAPAVADYERLLGPEDATTAQARMSLGTVQFELGDLDEARRNEERAIEVLSKVLGATDYRLLAAQTNLAATLNAMGDDRAARATHQRLIAVYSRLYGPDHAESLRARHNLAICMLHAGEFNEASAEFEALSASFQRLKMNATTDAEMCDFALADAYNKLGRFQDSLRVMEARRQLRVELGLHDASGDWRLFSITGQARLGVGELEQALQQAEAALRAATRALPPENPDLAEMREAAARLNLKLGKQDRAFELTREALLDAQGYLARCATTLSMSQAEAAQAHWSRLVSDGIALLDATASKPQRAQADALAFELAESARGIGTALLRCTQAGSSADVEALRRKVREAAREVAKVGAGTQDAAVLEAAIAVKERVERELRDALTGLIGPELAGARPSAGVIGRSLAADEALIAYWRIDVRALDAPLSTPREARLCAFVLRANQPVRKFDLGPLAPIAAAVQAWRFAIGSGEPEAVASEAKAGEALRRLVIDPLLASIGDAARWRVALDDALHLVALDAMPLQGGRLGDKARIVVAATSARLSSTGVHAATSGTFLALGGVDYDYQPKPDATVQLARGDTASRLAKAIRADAQPAGFGALWETQNEIDALTKLYGETHDVGSHIVRLTKREATKHALVQAAAEASAIHIATHGFFVRSAPGAASASESTLAQRSPLALCGLALTGANAGSDEHGFDAVITAEELATLDLSGCQLVVLSACDTNVGTLSAGQGVASFQKALHAAGARIVVTSLWKVNDDTTRELMLGFYKGMWIDQLSPEEALWRAKSQRIARRAPVRDWAGWVLSRQ